MMKTKMSIIGTVTGTLAVATALIASGLAADGLHTSGTSSDDPRPEMRRLAKRYIDLIQETRRTRLRHRAALFESEGEFLYSVLVHTSPRAVDPKSKRRISTDLSTALSTTYGHPGMPGGMSFRRRVTTTQEQLEYSEVWNRDSKSKLSQKWVVRERVMKPVGGVDFLMRTDVSNYKINEESRWMTFHFERGPQGELRIQAPNLRVGEDTGGSRAKRSISIPAAIMLHFNLLGHGALRLAWPL